MNAKFRQYVTDVAFRLTLGKTHITALTAVKMGQVFREKQPGAGQFAKDCPVIMFDMGLWVPAINQLEARGLVLCATRTKGSDHLPFFRRYQITRAGELAWDMLVEAGLVEEIIAPAKAKKRAA